MKKICLFVMFLLLSTSLLCGCKTQNLLIYNVSELRTDVFYGQSQNYKLKAGYGFKESPFNADGRIEEKDYFLTFRLLDHESSEQTFTLSLSHGGKSYDAVFKLNPVNHALSASVKIENFKEKEFTVSVSTGSDKEDVLMTSLLPEKTISFVTALDKLQNDQRELLKNYTDDNGNFTAEIHLRVLVKDDKPYWFIGIIENQQMKAFLMDGINGQILAVREIF